jgi:two-component system cell cycle response regulator DivK
MEKRILFIEDNDDHRFLTQDMLEHYGYTVFGSPNGANFLPLISSFRPHVILLDLKLPGKDGFALLEELLISNWHTVPVIVVSAFTFRKEKLRAFHLGARRYLTKPVNLNTLMQAIEAEIASSKPDLHLVVGFPVE